MARKTTAREEYILRSVRAWGKRPLSAEDVSVLVQRAFSLTQAEVRHLLREQFAVQLDLFED